MSAGSLVAATDWTGIAMKLDPSNQILSTWDSNSDACANPPFKGVKCNANKEVIEISLRSLGLSGEVPPEIVQLNKLTWLDLGENSLHGNIPVDIANLPSLMVLNLCCNNIGGVIPDLGRMSNLLAIDLSNNILSDTIPASLGDLPQLKFLELNNNQLSGEIPASIGNLKRLKSISLAHNQLQGRVPKGLNYLRDSPAKYNFSENGYGFCGTGFKGLDTCPGDPPYVSKKSPPKSGGDDDDDEREHDDKGGDEGDRRRRRHGDLSLQPLVPLSPPPGSATPSASAPADTLSSGTAAAADSGSSGGNSSTSASSSSSSGGESSGGMSMGVYIGIAAGGALLVIVATILIGYCCWWKPKQSRAVSRGTKSYSLISTLLLSFPPLPSLTFLPFPHSQFSPLACSVPPFPVPPAPPVQRAAAFRAIRSDKDLNPPSASKRGYGSSKSKGKARSPTGAEAAGGDAGGESGAAAAAGAAAGAATGAAIAGSGRSSSKKKSPSKRHSPSKHHRIDIESGNNGASGYHSVYHTVDVPPVTVVELPPEPAVRSVREPEAAVSAVSATGAAAGAAIAGAGSKSKGRGTRWCSRTRPPTTAPTRLACPPTARLFEVCGRVVLVVVVVTVTATSQVFEASPPAIPPSVPRNRDSTPPRMPSWSRTGNRNSPSPGGSNHRSSSPNRSYHGTPPKPAEPVPILREEGIPTVVEIPVDSDENQIKSGGSNRPVLIPPAVPIPQLKSMPAGAASRKKGGRNGGGAGEDDVSPAPQPNRRLAHCASQRNVLGTGRDGSVYKARLPDGTTVAVKRLTQRNLDQSAREFRFEVESLAHARHPNLVALLGCCAEEDERMLVYEFVPNGSLDAWLHQNSNMEPIDWPMRMHIAIGCARGLSHLHEGLDMKVVHRDVKASNVLLDAQWNPKLGDFAIAKVMGRDQSHTATRVVGTFGYVAPEYMNTGLLTERSDVYSFGVLLLEIISGRKPIDNGAPPDEMDLVTWAKKLSSQERLVEIVDPRLQGMISPDDAEYVLGIAMRCVETNALKRPRMTQIVHMLESEDPKQVSRRPFRPQPVQLMAI
ncbi:unnamed protein product [Closterium sp. NIES-53]